MDNAWTRNQYLLCQGTIIRVLNGDILLGLLECPISSI